MAKLRLVAAVLLGIVIGAAVNMGLVIIGPLLIPTPPGMDPANPESIASHAHLLQAKHFIFPFLAHALGTFVGATIAHIIANQYRNQLAFGIGGFFLLGGIMASTMIPAPIWFIVLDLLVAYLPMAYLATKVGEMVR